MARWTHAIRRYLPHRRRRAWRYVSLRRRGAGLVVFGLLLLLVYGYSWVTDDNRVKAEAVQYLSRLTGGRAKIAKAHFSIFGGVRLENVRLYLDAGNAPPFFEASQVVMNHRLSALLRGRVEPTEITCFKPHIRLIENARTQQWNVKQVFPLAEHGPGSRVSAYPARLPAIRLREGELELLDADEDGNLLPVTKSPLPVMVALLPDKNVYQVSIEGGQGVISGTGTINTRTGETDMAGSLGLEGLDRALPRKYRQWRQQYKLKGQINLSGQARLLQTTSGPSAVEQLTAQLEGVSMELPPQQGGLRLAGVQGRVSFHGNAMVIEKITGRIEQAPQATASVTGSVEGYGPDAIFDLHLAVGDLELPLEDLPAEVPWSAQINDLMHRLEPRGKVNLLADVSRDGQGKVQTSLRVSLQGLSAKVPDQSLRLESLGGEVLLTQTRIELHEVTGRLPSASGSAESSSTVTLNGWGEDLTKEPRGELTISAHDLPLTPAVHDAMPPNIRQRWDDLAPAGLLDCTVQIARLAPEVKASVKASFNLTGKASMAHKDFPYRVEGITGRVDVDEMRATIHNVRGKSGQMSARANGYVASGDWEITLDATDVPLDETLRAALPKPAREPYRACGLSGRASLSDGYVRRRPGEDVDWHLPITLNGASMTHDWLPYRLDEVVGKVLIEHSGLEIRELTGRHDKAQVRLSGQLNWSGAEPGIDLRVGATDLALDESVHHALPPAAAGAWQELSPGGLTDVDCTFHRAPLDAPTQYRLIFQPRSASIRYKRFPYPLHDIQGQAVLENGCLRLHEIVAQAGQSGVKIFAEGEIRPGDPQRWADLELHSGPIPVDADLLGALPRELVKSLGMRGGGTLALDLDHLQLRRCGLTGPWPTRGDLTTQPATQPQTSLTRGQLTSSPAAATLPTWLGTVDIPEADVSGDPTPDIADETAATSDEGFIAPVEIGGVELTSRPATARVAKPASQPVPAPTSHPNGSPAWRWQGRFHANNAIVAIGIDAKSITGTLAGEMSTDGATERLFVEASLDMDKISVGPRQLQNLQAIVTKAADSPTLRADSITCRAYGGYGNGTAEISLGPDAKYALSLAVENADLAKFLTSAHPAAPVDAVGAMSGNLQLSGALNDPDSRQGRGKIHVERARMFRLPVMLGFFNALSLALPGEPPFNLAEVEYSLRGPILTFQEIYLEGTTAALLGTGTLDTRNEALRLTFLSGPPRRLPRLAGLTDIIQHLAGEIVAIRVTGTISNPHSQTVPMHSLGDAMRDMLQPQSSQP